MTPAPDQEQRSLRTAESARQADWTRPSFVGQLFMGRLATDLLFPFPEQADEERAAGDRLLSDVRNLLAAELDPDAVDREGEIPDSVVKKLADLGLFGIKIPEEYGGLGLSQTNYNRIAQLVASHCSSTAVLLSAHQSIGVPQPLKMFGTEEQKQRFLPRLAKGAISAFALTEPGVGSDPSTMQTRARLEPDGRHWVIDGEKLWISNGPVADLLVVMARTNDPEAGQPEITAFIVEGDSPGLTCAHRCRFMGLNGIQNGLLRFEGVRVPAENVLGGVGEGLKLALVTLNTGRLTLPAAAGGVMKQAVTMARTWAAERHQWGAAVGKHEAVAHRLSAMAADTLAVESIAWLTSGWADNDRVDMRLEAACAKLWCTEALWRCVDSLVQIRGGRGYETADSLRGRGEAPMPAERLLRDARINLIIEGTSEIMRLFIAREALDPHLRAAGLSGTEGRVNVARAARFYARWYPGLWFPSGLGKVPALHGLLTRHLRYVERGARLLARDLFHMLMLYRQGLQRKQAVLGRLVDMGADLFAMAAVLAYSSARSSPSGCEPLADLFCRQARRRIRNLHRAVYGNDDQFAYDRAGEVLSGRYPWLEENIITAWRDTDA